MLDQLWDFNIYCILFLDVFYKNLGNLDILQSKIFYFIIKIQNCIKLI